MKLDPQCIREILLAVEDKTDYYTPVSAFEVAEATEFDRDVVLYHIRQCELYGYFTEVRRYVNGDDDCVIIDLSPKGHEFLRDIRSEKIWDQAMKKILPLGTVSLSILQQVASSIILKQLSL